MTFDSPGALPMMEKLQSNIKSRQTQVNIDDIEIVTYLAKPNPINCCNEHVGSVYKIEVKMGYTDKVNNALSDKSLGATIKGILAVEGQALRGIVASFDPEAGKPKSYRRIIDWPRIKYTGEAKQFSTIGEGLMTEGLLGGVSLASDFFPILGQVTRPLNKIAGGVINYLIGDTTLMTMVGFIKSMISNEFNRDQYWAYFENIDWEKEEKESSEEGKN